MANLDTYQTNLVGLLLLCGTLLAVQRSKTSEPASKKSNDNRYQSGGELKNPSQLPFYIVYTLVMASDWLQGPFLYSLYKDEHFVPAALIPPLFTTGFLSGAISATFLGTLADRLGRRFACLSFSVLYSLSCLLTILSPSLSLLFLGRILGGVSTSLLFSVFESWMVTDFHNRGMEKSGKSLSETFGKMSTLNSVVAILSGVFSEWLVRETGTRKAPFGVSVLLLMSAWILIYTQWDENYGERASLTQSSSAPSTSLTSLLTNKRLLSLGLASTMFEGSMYLFVFFWTPALQSSSSSYSSSSSSLPYGIIFASFMSSTMATSLLFTLLMSSSRPLLSHKSLLLIVLTTSAFTFRLLSTAFVGTSEQAMFWLFCLFEGCVGMYWPTIGFLKGEWVEDGVRAKVYGLLRVPLNVFVVVSLAVSGEGSGFTGVFLACSMFLGASAAALAAAVVLGTP